MRISSFLDSNALDDSFPLPRDRPFTAVMAMKEGVSRSNLARLVDHQLLRRPVLGSFLATEAGDSTMLRAQSLGLVVPEHAVICDRHAAWLHGAEMVLAPNEHINLQPISVFVRSGKTRLRNGLCDSGERNLTKGDLTEVHGLRVTTPLRTACDLGRVRNRYRALAAIDQLYRLGVDRDEVIAEVPRFKRMRWVTHLRALAPLGDGRAASPPESYLRLIWIDAGLPTPQLQIEVWEGGVLIAVIDLGLEELRFGSEYDGDEWHGTPIQAIHDGSRRDYLAYQYGWSFEIFVNGQLFGPDAHPESRLARGLHNARLRAAV